MAGQEQSGLNLHRLSPELQAQLKPLYDRQSLDGAYLVGGFVEKWALDAGFYPYDRRIWVKDPAWKST